MRFEVNLEAKSLLVNLSGRARGDLGFAHEALSLVTENKSISIHAPIEFAGPIKFFVLHLKQIGKVGIRFNPHIQVDRRGFVIQNLDVFMKASAHRTLSHDGQWRIYVDGSGAWDQKELRREIIDVVGGQRVGVFSVHSQDPAREETSVPLE